MARLPTPGSDNGLWGGILNDYLSVSLEADGTLKRGSDIDAAKSTAQSAQQTATTAQTDASAAQTTANAAQSGLAAKLDKSTATTKGDLLVASAASTIGRLGVGANGQRLVADSAQALGMRWQNDAFIMASDYGVTFDGATDDATALQAAINAAISAKRPLFLSPGTAIVGTALSINATVSIVGSGRESTVLKAKNGLNNYVISFTGGGAGVGIVGAHFSDFAIDGNSANVTAGGGIKADGAVQCSFERLHCYSVYDWGLKLGPITGGAFGHHNRVVGCLFDNSGSSAGFGGGVWTTSSDENWFVQTDFEFLGGSSNPVDNNPVMLYDQAGLQYIIGCNFVSGSHDCIGVRIQNTKQTRVVGCVFDGTAGDGVYVVAESCVIANNTFTGIGDNGSTAASGVHTQYGAAYNVIANNVFRGSDNVARVRSHIREEQIGNSGPNLIEGNTFAPGTFALTVAAVESAGNGTVVRNNIGWTTEANGAATVTAAATTIAVTHGLSVTPALANISVTPTNSLGASTKFWISGVGATQFTINVDAVPGAPTAMFAWSARL
jgi:hypothetical protein